jgi:anti-sigma B factor antagonist
MDIKQRIEEGCVILDIEDDRFGYPKTVVLKSHINHLLQEGNREFILNLADVGMLDSFGLASIISILKLCKASNGNLSIYGLNPNVAKLIEITHMDRVLDIWETEKQAIYQMTKLAKAR